MIMKIEDYVNELPGSASLGFLPDYVCTASDKNPIDEFDSTLKFVLKFGTLDLLESDNNIGRLLVISLVSAVENYVRSIIAGTVELCPLSQACASERSVNLGSVIWHSGNRYSRSAYEHSSLADAKGISKAFKEFLDISLPVSDFSGLLDEYEKICQLRHGIVHSDGFLPGKNAIKLQIPRQQKQVRIIIRYRQLQEVAGVLDSLVKLINRHIFLNMCKRWALDWRRRSDWDPSMEEKIFNKIWNLCLYGENRKKKKNNMIISKSQCIYAVRVNYGLI